MENRDKVYELELSGHVIGGKLRIQNSNNRVVAKIGDIILDKLNYYRWSNAVKFLDKYERKKEKRKDQGKEIPLPPKFVFEILDNAFMEETDGVQELWANLLLNWEYAKNRNDMGMVFVEILRNLSRNEIMILLAINESADRAEVRNNKGMYIDGAIIKEYLMFSEEDYELAMLNLFRLFCCEGFHNNPTGIFVGGIPIISNGGIEKFRVTALGYKLLDLIFDEDSASLFYSK